MKHTLQCLLVMLLLFGNVPGVAHSGADQDSALGPPPSVPAPERTGVLPVDETVRDVHLAVNDAGSSTWSAVDAAVTPLLPGEHDPMLVLFNDGHEAADAERLGGYGAWYVMGGHWQQDALAGHLGSAGRGIGTTAYPPRADAVLLSPIIDLATGAAPEAAAGLAQVGNGGLADGYEAGQESVEGARGPIAQQVHGLVLAVADLLEAVGHEADAETLRGEADILARQFPWPANVPSLGVATGERTYGFSTLVRFNLQPGLDGVQLRAYPGPVTDASCVAPSCTVLTPVGGYPGAVPDLGPAFTGAADWTEVTLDLSRFAGQDVRIGLAFHGVGCPGGCPVGSARLDATRDHVGFQIDDSLAWAAAPEHNVRVRTPLRPAASGPAWETTPTPGQPFPYGVQLGNVGRNEETIDVALTLESAAGPTALPGQTVTLAPGAVATINGTIAALGEGTYTLRVEATTSVDDVPADNEASVTFEVAEVRAATIRSLEAFVGGAPVRTAVPIGVTTRYVASVANEGNVGRSFTLEPRLWDVTDNVTLGNAPQGITSQLEVGAQTLWIDAGDTQDVIWNFAPGSPMQARMDLTLRDGEVLDDVEGVVIGFGRSPPPLFLDQDADGAPRGTHIGDWTITGTITNNTAPEGPWEQGWYRQEMLPGTPTLYYMGLSEDSPCRLYWEAPCPYALHRSGKDFVSDNYRERPVSAILESPAIWIDPTVPDPQLYFSHQFSTAMKIGDCAGLSCVSTIKNIGVARIEGRVGIAQSDGSIAWQDWTWLQSRTTPYMDGYSGEVATGITYPGFPGGPRHADWDPPWCSGGKQAETCGWWWPSGIHRVVHYEGIEDTREFHFGDGSPWLLEQIPLVGLHGEEADTYLDARGAFMQFRFDYPHTGNSNIGTLPYSQGDPVWGTTREGWRIGGVAVLPTAERLLDLGVVEVAVNATYDAARVGLGPDTRVAIDVMLQNHGSARVERYRVEVAGIDIAGQAPTAPICSDVVVVDEPLDPGERHLATLQCLVAATGTLRFNGRVGPVLGGDDLPLDNAAWDSRTYVVSPYQDVAIEASASPVIASQATSRTLTMAVRNVGNTIVDGVEVMRTITKADGANVGQVVQQRTWRLDGALEPGAAVDLSAGATTEPAILPRIDLVFQPPAPGAYTVTTSIAADGDQRAANDVRKQPLRADAVLYQTTFDAVEQGDAAVVETRLEKPADPWRIDVGGADGSAFHLRLGEPATGDVPADGDMTLDLPPFDLTTVREATLSFQHRYELEEGFDGAVVEVSTDGGTTWEAFQPRSGDAIGYPETTMIGATPLLATQAEAAGVAYTGRSGGPGSVDGWRPAEFRFSDHPAFRRQITFEDWAVPAPSSPATQPADASDPRFRHPTWSVAEENAEANQRYWWVQNLTYAAPSERAEATWWSGTRGTDSHEIHTNLVFQVEMPDAGTLSWTDWRDGWEDAWQPRVASDPWPTLGRVPDDSRPGRGGAFRVFVDDTEVDPRTIDVVVFEPDGWTTRSMDVPAGAHELRFRYDGDQLDAANHGWFVTQPLAAGSVGAPGIYHETGSDAQDVPYATNGWVCVGPSPCVAWAKAHRGYDAGWHTQDVLGPGGSVAPAWRFAADNDQGYPHASDARLVTPAIDLGRVAGASAALHFDHRYGFEATPSCVRLGLGCGENSGSAPPLNARDGGAVEYQVLNETTGEYGEWRVLIKASPEYTPFVPEDGAQIFALPQDQGGISYVDRFAVVGYPAVFYPTKGASISPLDDDEVRCCTFGTHPFPAIPVYSGTQADWQRERFDVSPLIGKTVRFAFHAWTDSSFSKLEPLEGWSIANVGVEGEVFEGRPASVRLRAVTDGSVTKGSWQLDDISLVGQRYKRNVAITTDATEMTVDPGTWVHIDGEVANFGSAARTALAWRAIAETADGTPVPTIPTRVVDGEQDEVFGDIPSEQADGAAGLQGPFSLNPGGRDGSRFPFRLQVQMPATGTVTVRMQLFEDLGTSVLQDGVRVHQPHFKAPKDEVPGNTKAYYSLTVGDTRDLGFLPGPSGRSIEVSRIGSAVGEPVQASVHIVNQGSGEENITIAWTIRDRATGAKETYSNTSTLAAGDDDRFTRSWTPTHAGVYRLGVALLAGSTELASATIDLPIGQPAVYLDAPFGSAAWKNATAPHQGVAGVPNTWRLVDGAMLWGPTGLETLQSGDTYCRVDGAALCPMESCVGCEQAMGPEAWLGTTGAAPVDLRIVPGDTATLVIDERWDFAPGDGGRVEVAIFRDPAAPSYWCTDASSTEAGRPAWFALTPRTPYPGSSAHTAARQNALGAAPARTGVGAAQTAFDLGAQAAQILAQAAGQSSACQSALANGLMGHQIAIRLHAGTQAADGKVGGKGWHIEGVHAGIARLDVGPEPAEGIRHLPVRPGVAKEFRFTVANWGAVDDDVTFTQQGLPDAWWNSAAVERVQPGATALVTVRVALPHDAPTGLVPFTVVAESRANPGIKDTMPAVLEVRRHAAPDLSLELRLDEASPETGTPTTVTLVVNNQGDVASEEVRVQLLAGLVGVEPRAFHEAIVPALCPYATCGKDGSRFTYSAQWITPNQPGSYQLIGIVDPKARLIESDINDNVQTRIVQVSDPQVPDLAAVALDVDAGHVVEAGSFFVLNATFANLGQGPAENVIARLVFGGALVAEKTISSLAPGETVQVSVLKSAPVGEYAITAFITGETARPESRVDNNELVRGLSVIGHDLQVAAPDKITVAAGVPRGFAVNFTNHQPWQEHLDVAAVAPDGWTVSVYPQPMVVPPASTTRGYVLVQPPVDARAGTHALRIEAQPVGVPAKSAGVDLLAEVLGAPGTVNITEATWESGRVRLLVTDAGNLPRQIQVAIAGVHVGSWNLSAGPTQIAFDHALPRSLAPGDHSLAIEVLEAGAVQAQARLDVHVPAARDMQTTWGAPTWQLGPDGTLRAIQTLTIEHVGNVPFDLSPEWQGPVPAEVSPMILHLAPDHTYTVTVSMEAADGMDLRGAGALLLAGPNGTMATLAPPTAPARPNLQVSHIRVDAAHPKAGRATALAIDVMNDGDARAAPSFVIVTANTRRIAAIAVPALDPGATVTVVEDVVLPAGSVALVAMADGDARVPEVRRDDNGRSTLLSVAADDARFIPAPSIGLLVLAAVILHWRRRR